VQVAVQVRMPTPEERAQRDLEHRKLEEIARSNQPMQSEHGLTC